MKQLIVTVALLLLSALTSFAQKKDYTQYNIIAQAKDVTIIVKDNDYRMVVGQLKKPKTVFFLGYSKEQASQSFRHLLEQVDNKSYSSNYRQIRFCGANLQMTTPDIKADDALYVFVLGDNKVKYTLSKSDISSIIDLLQESEDIVDSNNL